ncbi:Malate dehydrogenase 2 [Durusdinium trenchii]|uniref:Mitochondrial n=1 Tax=Durusdinium trenchii TaxID=1381693 RepID=A0ABP0LXX9_9DINO
MYKWAKPRLAQNWPLLCKAAPQIAKKFKEIPDVLRKFMGLKGKFRARLSSNETGQKTIPSSLMSVVSDCVVERIELGEEVNYHLVKNILAEAIDQWNHAVRGVRLQLTDPEFVLKEVAKECPKELHSDQDVEQAIESVQKRVDEHLQEVQLKKHAQRLCRKCGILLTQNSKPGRHLPFHHPQMEKVRTWVNYQIASGAVNGQLLANFDQVWSLLYRPASRTLRQSSSVPDPHSKELSLRKIRHCIQRVMDLPLTESFEPKPSDGIRQVQGGPAGHSPVESYRIPRTLTTLSWADGAMGRGFVTCKSDHMSEKDRNQANQELAKWLYIAPLQSKTHIWSSETMLTFLDFMAGELRARRRELNLDISQKAMIVCDMASQHSSKKFAALKEAWSQQHNAVLICGDSEVMAIPGGWGAAGGPNDGWHQYAHKLTSVYHSLAIQWGETLELRKRLSELNVSPQGSISTKQLGRKC